MKIIYRILGFCLALLAAPAFSQGFNPQSPPQISNVARGVPVTETVSNLQTVIWHVTFNKQVVLLPHNFQAVDNSDAALSEQKIEIGQRVITDDETYVYPILLSEFGGFEGIVKLALTDQPIRDVVNNELSGGIPADAENFNFAENAPFVRSVERLDGNDDGLYREPPSNYPQQFASLLRFPTTSIRWRVSFSKPIKTDLTNAFAVLGNTNGTTTIAVDSENANAYIVTHTYQTPFRGEVELVFTNTQTITDQNDLPLRGQFPLSGELVYEIYGEMTTKLVRHTAVEPSNPRANSPFVEWELTFGNEPVNFTARDLVVLERFTERFSQNGQNFQRIVERVSTAGTWTITQQDDPRVYIVRFGGYGIEYRHLVWLEFLNGVDIRDRFGQAINGDIRQVITQLRSTQFSPAYTGQLSSIEYINEPPVYIEPTEIGGDDFYDVRFRFTFNVPVRSFTSQEIEANVATSGITVAAVNPDNSHAEQYIATIRLPANFSGELKLRAKHQGQNFSGAVRSRGGAILINLPFVTQSFDLQRPEPVITTPQIPDFIIENIQRLGGFQFGTELSPQGGFSEHVTGARGMSWLVTFSHDIDSISANDFEIVMPNDLVVVGDVELLPVNSTEKRFQIILDNYQAFAIQNISGDDPTSFQLRVKENNNIVADDGRTLENLVPRDYDDVYFVHPVLQIVDIRRRDFRTDPNNFQLGWWIEYNRAVYSPTPTASATQLFRSDRYMLTLSSGEAFNLFYRRSTDNTHWVTIGDLANNNALLTALEKLTLDGGNMTLTFAPEYIPTSSERNEPIAIPNRQPTLYANDPISLPDVPILPEFIGSRLIYSFGVGSTPVLTSLDAVGNNPSQVSRTARRLQWRFTFSHVMQLPSIDDFDLILEDVDGSNPATLHPNILRQIRENTTIRRGEGDDKDIIYEIGLEGLRGVTAEIRVRISANHNIRTEANSFLLAHVDPVNPAGNTSFKISTLASLVDITSNSNRTHADPGQIEGVDANTHANVKIIQVSETDTGGMQLHWDFTFSTEYGHTLEARERMRLDSSLSGSEFDSFFDITFQNLPAPANDDRSRIKRAIVTQKHNTQITKDFYLTFEARPELSELSYSGNIPSARETAFLILTPRNAQMTVSRRWSPKHNDTVEVEGFPFDTRLERTIDFDLNNVNSRMVFQTQFTHTPASINNFDFNIITPTNDGFADANAVVNEIVKTTAAIPTYNVFVDIPAGFEGEQEMRLALAENHNLFVPAVNLNWRPEFENIRLQTSIPATRFSTARPTNTDFKKQNQGFLVDTFPALEKVERISPTSENAFDVDQVQWRFTFSEPIKNGRDGGVLSTADFQHITNGNSASPVGTMSVAHVAGEKTVLVTISGLRQFDGVVQAKFGGGVPATQLPIDSSTLTSTFTGSSRITPPFRLTTITARENPTHDRFTISSIPRATVTRTSGTNGVIRQANALATWDIAFNENVTFNALAYTIIRPPQGASITKTEVNQKLHRISVQIPSGELFVGTVDLEIDRALIKEVSPLPEPKSLASVKGETQYDITSAIVIDSITRINTPANATVTRDLATISQANHPRWRVQFSEDVTNLSLKDFKIIGDPALLPAELELRQHALGSNFIEVTPFNLNGYDGTLRLRLIDRTPLIASGALSLLSSVDTQNENDNTIIYKQPPRIDSISHRATDSVITWQIDFNEPVQNVDVQDFTITPSVPIINLHSAGLTTTISPNANLLANTSWILTTNGIEHFAGDITLALKPTHAITDFATPPIALANDEETEIFSKANIAPRLLSISRLSPTAANVTGLEVEWQYEFSEPVQNFREENINIASTKSFEYETIHLVASNNETTWAHKIKITRGFTGTAVLTPSIISPSLITDYNNFATLPLATPAITAETFTIDPPLQLLAIRRHSPSTETALNQTQVQWQYVFTEPAFANDSSTEITISDFTITATRGTPILTRTDATYTITFGNYASLDETISIALNSATTFFDSVGQQLLAPAPTPNENSFVLQNGAIGEIVRQSIIGTTQTDHPQNVLSAIISGANPTLVWRISYNEAVVFDANAYSVVPVVPNANPQVARVSATVHTITIENFGEFQNTLDLQIDPAKVKDVNDNNLDLVNTNGERKFTIDTRSPRITAITRHPAGPANTENSNLSWLVQFDEQVREVDVRDFFISDESNDPILHTINSVARQANSNSWIVAATITDAYPNRKQIFLRLKTVTAITDVSASQNALHLVIPQSQEYRLDVAPRLVSVERSSPSFVDARGFDEVTWQLNFSEKIKNFDRSDFALSHNINFDIAYVANADETSHILLTAKNILASNINGELTVALAANPTIFDNDNSDDIALANTAAITSGNNMYRIGSAPTISLERLTPFTPGTKINVAQVQWQITFSEAVNAFAATNFSTNITATLAVARTSSTVSTLTATLAGEIDSEIELSLNSNHNIQLETGVPFIGTLEAAQSTAANYFIDTKNPRLRNIQRSNNLPLEVKDLTSLSWQIDFDETINVTGNPYTIVATPSTSFDVAFDEVRHKITVSNYGGFDGTFTLQLTSPDAITDNAILPNAVSNVAPLGINNNVYSLQTSPRLLRIERATANDGGNVDGTQIAWRLVFSEPINNLTTANLAITNASNFNVAPVISAPTSSDNITWLVNVRIDATYAGRQTIGLELVNNGAGIFDRAPTPNALVGGTPSGANNEQYQLDVPPRLLSFVKTSGTGKLLSPAQLQWQVTFSEPVRDIENADFSANNSTLEITHSDDTATATIIASNFNLFDGIITLSLDDSPSINDMGGQAMINFESVSTANNNYEIGFPPTFTLTRHTAYNNIHINNSSIEWRILFDEPIASLQASDFTLTSTPTATAAVSLRADGANAWIISANNFGSYEGRFSLQFSSTANIEDVNNNALVQTIIPAQTEFLVDTKQPVIQSIARISAANSLDVDSVSWAIVFDENVTFNNTGVNSAYDIAITGSGKNYNVTLANFADLDGTLTLDLIHANIIDRANNPLATTTPATFENTITVGTRPSVNSIVRVSPTIENAVGENSVTWQINFSENVTLAKTNIAISSTPQLTIAPENIVLSGSGSSYNIMVQNFGSYDGTLTFALQNENSIVDGAGNSLLATAVSNTFIVGTLPTATISRFSPTSEIATGLSSVTWQVQFSENVRNFDVPEVQIDIGQIAITEISASTYNIVATNIDDADRDLSFNLLTGDITDLAGNALAAATVSPIFKTGARPTITAITRQSPVAENAVDETSVTWNVNFSENVILEKNNIKITINNGTNLAAENITLGGSGASHTITATGYGEIDGTLTLLIETAATGTNSRDTSGKIVDTSSTPATFENRFTIGTSPRINAIRLTSHTSQQAGAGIAGAVPLTFEIEFSENITGFVDDDINVILQASATSTQRQVIFAEIENLAPTAAANTYSFTVRRYSQAIDFDRTIHVEIGDNNIIDNAGNNLIANRQSPTIKIFRSIDLTHILRRIPTTQLVNRATNSFVEWELRFSHEVKFAATSTTQTSSFEIADLQFTQIAPDGTTINNNNGLQIELIAGEQVSNYRIKVTPNTNNAILQGGTLRLQIAANANIESKDSANIIYANDHLPLTPANLQDIYAWRAPPELENIIRTVATGTAHRSVDTETLGWEFEFSEPVVASKTDFQITLLANNPTTSRASAIVDARIKTAIENSLTISQDTLELDKWNVTIGNMQGFHGFVEISLAPNNNVNASGLTLASREPTNGNFNFYRIDSAPRLLDITRLTNSGVEDLTSQHFPEIATLEWQVLFSQEIVDSSLAQAFSVTSTDSFTISFEKIAERQYKIIATPNQFVGRSTADLVLADTSKVTNSDTRQLISSTPLFINENSFSYATQPILLSINRTADENQNGNSLTWEILFNENVSTVRASDFIATTQANDVQFNISINSENESRRFLITATTSATYSGAKVISLALQNNNNIVADGFALHSSRPQSQTYNLDVAPTLQSITRHSPTTAAASNPAQVQWLITFSENIHYAISANDISPSQNIGTKTINHASGQSSAIFTLSNFIDGGFDGDISIALANINLFVDSVGNQLIAPNITAQKFTISSNPTANVVRTTSSNGIVSGNNNTLQWIINFNENVSLPANSYSVVGAPSSAQLSARAVSNTQHEITLANLAIFDGEITLAILANSIADNSGNNVLPLNAEQTKYTLNAAPEITDITRLTQPSQTTLTANIIEWRITFNEAIKTFPTANIQIQSTPTATISATLAKESDTSWRVTTSQINNFEGDITLAISPTGIIDNANNNLASATPTTTDQRTASLDTRQPTISSVTRIGTSPAINQTSVAWNITFSEPVVNVSNSDFSLRENISGMVLTLTSQNNNYILTASNYGSYDGSLTLALSENVDIKDAHGNSLVRTLPTASFTVGTRPRLTSISRKTPTTFAALGNSFVEWEIIFSETVTGLAANNFEISGAEISPTLVGSGTTYTIKASGLDTFDGTISLTLARASNIVDAANIALVETSPTGINDNSFQFNRPPQFESFTRLFAENAVGRNSLEWQAVFSEPVVNFVNKADFVISLDPANAEVANDITINFPTRSGLDDRTHIVQLGNFGEYDGRISLSLANSHDIRDLATPSNRLVGELPANENSYLVGTPPTISAIHHLTPAIRNAVGSPSVTWEVQFSEVVRNVGVNDFRIVETIAGIQLAIDQETNDDVFRLTASNYGDYDGSISLELATSPTIEDLSGNAFVFAAIAANSAINPNENSFTLGTRPTIIAITRHSPTAENANTVENVVWNVRFSESVSTPAPSNFNFAGLDNVAPTITKIDNLNFQISVDVRQLDGTLTLTFANGNGIVDNNNNELQQLTPTSSNENTFKHFLAPTITLTRLIGTGENANNANALSWNATFSKPVLGFTNTALLATAQPSTTTTLNITGSGDTYTITVSNYIAYEGRIEINLASHNITSTDEFAASFTGTLDSNVNFYTVDNKRPTVMEVSTPTRTGENTPDFALTWTVTFSESVRNVDRGDFQVAQQVISPTFSFSKTNDQTYIVTAENFGEYDGNVSLSFAQATIEDFAGNDLEIATAQTGIIAIDTQAVTIDGVHRNNPTNQNARNATQVEWEINFSESVKDINESDFTITPAGTNLQLSGSGTTYTIIASGYGNYEGDITLELAANNDIKDEANNALTTTSLASFDNSFTVDTIAPTITRFEKITTGNTITTNTLEWQIEFSETLMANSFTSADLAIAMPPSAQINITATNNTVYTIVVTNFANFQGDIVLQLANGFVIEDPAGNRLIDTSRIAAPANSYSIDTKAPVISSLTRSNPAVRRGGLATTVEWEILFDEPVLNVDNGDFQIASEQLTSQQIANITIAVAPQTTPANSYKISVSGYPDFDGTIQLQIANSQNIADVNNNRLAMTNLDDADFIIGLAMPSVISLERQNPQQRIANNATTLTWEIIFTEPVHFTANNINVETDATINGITINVAPAQFTDRYTITVSNYGQYDGEIRIVENQATPRIADSDANQLIGGFPVQDNEFDVDTLPPTITQITRLDGTLIGNVTQARWEIIFSESVNVPADAFAVANATVIGSEGQTSNPPRHAIIATATFDKDDVDGEIVLELNQNHNIADLAGNPLANTLSQIERRITVDNTGPRINAIRWENPDQEIVVGQNEVAWRIIFSEDVDEFDENDINIIAEPNLQQTIEIMPTNNNREWIVRVFDITADYLGTITFNIHDQHDIKDTFNNRLSLTEPQVNQNRFLFTMPANDFEIISNTQKIIVDYLRKRTKQVLDSEPQFNKREKFAFNASNNSYNFAFANKIALENTGENIWVNINAVRTKDENSRSQTKIAHIAYENSYDENSNYGFLLQYDNTLEKRTDSAYKIDGHGWMAGPFFNVKVSNSFDLLTRFAWGESENEINNSYTFKTTREMIHAKIRGHKKIAGVNVEPNLGFKYYIEQQKEFLGENNLLIPSQKYSAIHASFGPRFWQNRQYKNLKFKTNIDFIGIYSMENTNSLTQNFSERDFTLQIKPGFSMRDNKGGTLNINGFRDLVYENIQSYGLNIEYSLPF